MYAVACALGILASRVCHAASSPNGASGTRSNPAYRRQTEAILSGVARSRQRSAKLGYDMAWADGGVQQVWGLGVPSWRLPSSWSPSYRACGAFSGSPRAHRGHGSLIYALLRVLAWSPCPEGTPLANGIRKRLPAHYCSSCSLPFSRCAELASMSMRRRRPTVSRRHRVVCLDAMVRPPAEILADTFLRGRGFAGFAAFVRPTLTLLRLRAPSLWLSSYPATRAGSHSKVLGGPVFRCLGARCCSSPMHTGSAPASNSVIS